MKVKMLQLASNMLRIDGPAVTATVSIGNSGLAIQTGVSIRAEIVQGSATKQAASLDTQCQPGDDPGFLPTGSCAMTLPVAALTSAPGSGTLVPGSVVFVLRLMHATDAGETSWRARAST